jgi:hypothetical protein
MAGGMPGGFSDWAGDNAIKMTGGGLGDRRIQVGKTSRPSRGTGLT